MLSSVVTEATRSVAQSTVGVAAEHGGQPSVPITLTLPIHRPVGYTPPYPLWVTAYGSYGNTLSTLTLLLTKWF